MFKIAVAKLAHSSTIPALAGNSDLRPLQEVIATEKLVLQSLQRLSTDVGKSASALQTWAGGEGEDLKDTFSACATLLNYWASSLASFTSHIAHIRKCLKAVRTREEELNEMDRRRKSLASKADSADKKLGKMGPENKNLGEQTVLLSSLRQQIRTLDIEIAEEEASLSDRKRTMAREWMGVLFGGLLECSEKGAVIATFGRTIVGYVSTEKTQPGLPRTHYSGHSQVESLVVEAERKLHEIAFVSEVGGGTLQPPNEFHIGSIPALPPPLPTRPRPTHQLAQSLPAAAEENTTLDTEFAKRLQAADDTGEIDMDAPEMQDADRVLSSDIITNNLLAQVMNDRSEGEVEVAASSSNTAASGAFSPMPVLSGKLGMLSENEGESKGQDEPLPEYSISNPYPACEICFEPFQVTHSPVSAALVANSTTQLPFGLRLPCPERHPYCISCLVEYIKGKLDSNGTGDVNTHTLVFPIRCPGCPHWETGIQDYIAEKVLDGESMSVWHHRKLLDSLQRHYCPNPKCSELLQIGGDSDDPKAKCPACSQWVCVPCKAMWHNDMSCEQFQSLPLDERSPEDRLAIELAESKQWRRCPACRAIVERTRGCKHITCLCKAEFCFKCGSSWDTGRRKCTSNPACDSREREGGVNVNRVAHVVARPAPPILAPPQIVNVFGRAGGLFQPPVHEPPRHELPRPVAQCLFPSNSGDFSWIDNPKVTNLVHPFTHGMITTLTCGYCSVRLNSLNDLRCHLSSVQYHSVFSCCGRFFKRESDLWKHRAAKPNHNYAVTRNARSPADTAGSVV